MKKPRILFVAAGSAQATAIREAREAGYVTAAMDANATAPGLALAEQAFVADILDAEQIVRCAREFQADGVVSIACDAAIEAVATATAKLGLPGIPLEVARTSRSKLRQRAAMESAGLLVPKYRLVRSADDARRAWDDFGVAACVIKPVDSSGSRGVSFVSDRNQVQAAFDLAVPYSATGAALVESFVPGIEYSVEAWVIGTKVHVLATSVKVRTKPPYLLDRQVHFPDDLPADLRERMVANAVRAIEACGFQNCPVHLECIESPDGPMVVELAARGPGFKVFTEMIPRVTGISTTEASIATSLGATPNLALAPRRVAASLAFIDPEPGVFARAEGVDEARAIPGVAEVVLYCRAGQRLEPLRSGADRAGHILVYDADADRCRSTAQAALEKIRLCATP